MRLMHEEWIVDTMSHKAMGVCSDWGFSCNPDVTGSDLWSVSGVVRTNSHRFMGGHKEVG